MPPVSSSRLFKSSCWQMEAQQPALGADRNVQARQGRTATKPREKTVQAEMDAGYGVYAGRKAQWATLVFEPRAAQWISHEQWHPEQEGRWLEDGRYELRLRGDLLESIEPIEADYAGEEGDWLTGGLFDLQVNGFGGIIGHMLKVNAGAYSFEAANCRHEHEYHVFEDVKLPAGKVIIPGVITHASNIVEHPQLIAERIMRYAKLVGRENVMPGADCGFSSQACYHPEVNPKVMWEKFKAMTEGARIASKKLWS